MKQTMGIDIGGRHIKADVSYQRRKTISLAVGPAGELIVKAPVHISDDRLRSFILSKRKWIEKRYDIVSRMHEAGIGSLEPGRKLFYKGNVYSLERTGDRICIRGNLIFLPSCMGLSELEEWYSVESKRMVSEFIEGHRIPHCTVRVKKQKRIWGSCNSGRRIYINSRISMCRESAFEYVMWHEVCHLKHMDHSKRFYNELERVFPCYKEEKEWLKVNEPYLRF